MLPLIVWLASLTAAAASQGASGHEADLRLKALKEQLGIEPQGLAARWIAASALDLQDLQEFCAEEECYLHAEALVYSDLGKKYRLQYETGAYLKDGRLLDHAWVSAPDGTIIDTTHGQFDRCIPVLVTEPGSWEHSRYIRAGDMTEEQLLETYGPA
jgi:hypothetical protein